MAYQSEAALEQQFIEQLNKQEYSTVDIPDYDALVENFKVQFEAFNAPKLDTPITDKEWERIFNLMLGKSVFQSAKILRDKFVLEREDGTKVYLSFFDQDHTKNIFQVTHQTTVVGKYVNRYDVTILVNGLPLIQVELKRRGIDIREAVNQVMRYKKHSYNGLYHFIQLFIVSNGVDTKYFANSDRDLMYSLAFFWTDFNNIRITNLKDFSISFLARDHIIKMLTRYTILNDTDKILMVMRPYQVYAVEALIRQATLTNRNAYIWHTTGAGKTLTSFKTAQILAANPNIKKVIFLVDRKDLDSQTTEEFNKFEAGSVDVTDRTDILVRQMKDKNRQLIVTTMQKMANAVKRPQYEKVMDAYRDEKVVFIIDECHRSQFGDMHKDIVRHFKKAQFFGFTGTPRFEVNGKTEGKITQTTEMLFGECLHNYLIKDALSSSSGRRTDRPCSQRHPHILLSAHRCTFSRWPVLSEHEFLHPVHRRTPVLPFLSVCYPAMQPVFPKEPFSFLSTTLRFPIRSPFGVRISCSPLLIFSRPPLCWFKFLFLFNFTF